MTDTTVGPPVRAVEEFEVGGDVVLFNGATDQVLVLNGTATAAWRLSDGSLDTDALVRALADFYRIDPERIRTQVVDLIEQLRRDGFLP